MHCDVSAKKLLIILHKTLCINHLTFTSFVRPIHSFDALRKSPDCMPVQQKKDKF